MDLIMSSLAWSFIVCTYISTFFFDTSITFGTYPKPVFSFKICLTNNQSSTCEVAEMITVKPLYSSTLSLLISFAMILSESFLLLTSTSFFFPFMSSTHCSTHYRACNKDLQPSLSFCWGKQIVVTFWKCNWEYQHRNKDSSFISLNL